MANEQNVVGLEELEELEALGPLVERLSKPVRESYKLIRELLDSHDADEIKKKYRVGQQIEGVAAEYGHGEVELLAKALGRDATTIYRWAWVARRWDWQEVEQMRSQPNVRGHHLSWSHLIRLAGADRNLERKLLEEFHQQGLTVRQLDERIYDLTPEPTKTTRIRPRSLKSGVAGMEKLVRKYTSDLSGRLGDVGMAVADSQSDDVDEKLLEKIEQDRTELLGELSELRNRLDASYSEWHEYVQELLRQKEAARDAEKGIVPGTTAYERKMRRKKPPQTPGVSPRSRTTVRSG